MAFTQEKAAQRLSNLNQTQQSIQSTSQWLLFHHPHHKTIVQTLCSKLIDPSSPSSKKLTLFYLANDIIQLSKKDQKYAGFLKEFQKQLPGCLSQISSSISIEDIPRFKRVITVWRDREIYSTPYLNDLLATLDSPQTTSKPIVLKSKNTSNQQDKQTRSSPPELIQLSLSYESLNQLSALSASQFEKLTGNYAQLFKSEHLPEPTKFISQLNTMIQLNSGLTQNIKDMTSSRMKIIESLEQLVKVQKDWIDLDQAKLEKLSGINVEVVDKKKELESLLDGASEDDEGDEDEVIPTYAEDDDDDEMPAYKDDNDNDKVGESTTSDVQKDEDEEPSPNFSVINESPAKRSSSAESESDGGIKKRKTVIFEEAVTEEAVMEEVSKIKDDEEENDNKDGNDADASVEIDMDLNAILNKLN